MSFAKGNLFLVFLPIPPEANLGVVDYTPFDLPWGAETQKIELSKLKHIPWPVEICADHSVFVPNFEASDLTSGDQAVTLLLLSSLNWLFTTRAVLSVGHPA